jgi:hypothetical protein
MTTMTTMTAAATTIAMLRVVTGSPPERRVKSARTTRSY